MVIDHNLLYHINIAFNSRLKAISKRNVKKVLQQAN